MRAERWAPSDIERIDALTAAERALFDRLLTADEWSRVRDAWELVARAEQCPPGGADWRVWLIMAGRGFGKTRSGAEWVDAQARRDGNLRIALVGASHDDARSVMVEGESGILACARGRERPLWHPALRRLVWPSGAMAMLYSAADPEGLRGPQHHLAWCDEVARWDAAARGAGGASAAGRSRAGMAWDNLLMGLRLGAAPRVCATTTPRAVPLMRTILAMDGLVRGGGSTLANARNLPASYLAAMREDYGDTLVGRQEIGGELIEDVPGALWTREMLALCRMEGFSPASPGGLSRSQANAAGSTAGEGSDDASSYAFSRVVIGVDPPASSDGDACGIVVAARLADGGADGPAFAVLADASVERAAPERWARAVASACAAWGADRIVAEANNGGDMVRRVLEAEDPNLPVTLVHAVRGKASRAEPIAHAYARGRVAHAGVFAALEDQLCGLLAGGGYAGPGRSPDRADACVWALSELMRGQGAAGPSVRVM